MRANIFFPLASIVLGACSFPPMKPLDDGRGFIPSVEISKNPEWLPALVVVRAIKQLNKENSKPNSSYFLLSLRDPFSNQSSSSFLMRLYSQSPRFNDAKNPTGWKSYTKAGVQGLELPVIYQDTSGTNGWIEAELLELNSHNNQR